MAEEAPVSANPMLQAGDLESKSADSGPTTLEFNRPAAPSPLKNSMTAADLEQASAPSSKQDSDSVENVIGSVEGVVKTAPAAAAEVISQTASELAARLQARTGASSGATSDSSSAIQQAQDGASSLASSAQATAQNLASQASAYLQQAADKLPTSISSAVSSTLGTTTGPPSHHHEMKVDDETRETTSAPLADKEGRPEGVQKAPIASTTTSQNPPPSGSDPFTQSHTTGNFEASGSLQATSNPEMLTAQSDLAAKAESGDL